MSDRRFTDKPVVDPQSVRGLGAAHAAMVENRTLFPSTVVTVAEDEPDRLLVSGRNNRKLGETVMKGAFKGYALYGLSLEERATCPDDCAVRDVCYGNGMQMARRHRIGDPEVFFDRLGFEICELLETAPGLLIRLHVLGDFPSVEYVSFWADALEEHEKLAVYGYTARRSTAWGGDEIGDAIDALKDRFPERFRIRWSSAVSRPDGAYVTPRMPRQPRIDEGIVCPSQTDATACCATCALCWEPSAARECIVFIRHGPKSAEAAAEVAMADAVATTSAEPVTVTAGARRVQALTLMPPPKPLATIAPTPEARLVFPQELLIESSYQRDLSSRSMSLIRKVVNGWDWAKFKPPVCAETPDGLFVIDGQHTAIAAATRGIRKIPVLVVSAAEVETRAAAFVSHNRDRLAMSPFQIFHADATAGDPKAREILAICERTGASIPRSPPPKGKAKPGQIMAINDARLMLGADGAPAVERLFRIAVGAELAPLGRMTLRALRMVLTTELFADVVRLPDSRISNALRAFSDLEQLARGTAVETGQSGERACASLIAEMCRMPAEAAA